MNYTIKDLQAQWLSKNLIYEALKTVLPFSKQFKKNKRIFDEKDIEMFQDFKNLGLEKTVLKYTDSQKQKGIKTVSNSLENKDSNPHNSLQEELKTVLEKEVELKQIIEQKEAIIKIKDEQTQKYALLKQEEKKEKDKWIGKYEEIQNEKNELLKKFYGVKMYMMIFLILFVLVVTFEVIQFLK